MLQYVSLLFSFVTGTFPKTAGLINLRICHPLSTDLMIRFFFFFLLQQIDGEAFLLLNQSDIVNILKIKLGPALKIFNTIPKF